MDKREIEKRRAMYQRKSRLMFLAGAAVAIIVLAVTLAGISKAAEGDLAGSALSIAVALVLIGIAWALKQAGELFDAISRVPVDVWDGEGKEAGDGGKQ